MFSTTRSGVIKNFINFSEKKLLSYSKKRNFDFGPPHKNVSKLSPYLKTRFISEEEVLKIAIKNNKIKTIEKFIEEVFWRTYWRGWLESHPWVYDEYLKTNKNQTIPDKTGIKCFDSWKEELLDTGYLHNHSRMWFASIWIFTLGNDWQSGAEFFKQNLLDYCPASNTLGWRWVAGLQSINKPYLAMSDNIKYFTNGRFDPKGELNEQVTLNQTNQSSNHILPFVEPIKIKFENCDKIGIILNQNDLTLNRIFEKKQVAYDCCIYSIGYDNRLINEFNKNIIEDILNNNKNFEIAKNFNQIIDWLLKKNIKMVILPYETVGNRIFNNEKFKLKLKELNIKYNFFLRDWDRNAFPHATKGFFKFKKNISHLINLADI
tara:strand:- start:604 stop:1731 length:1128 start_codon:yes stop_codon:yes gene_type:complete